MDFEAAKREREKRLRRRLLNALYHAQRGPAGMLDGQTLYDVCNGASPSEQFDDEDHALQLMREMATIGLAAESRVNRRKTRPFDLGNLVYRITADGVALYTEARPPHPMVADDRIPDEEG